MRKESKAERAAWSKYFGDQVAAPSKYGNDKSSGYDSLHEANEAAKLHSMQRAGLIFDLKEQVRFTLVPKNGKLRAVVYVADFTYMQDGKLVIADAKGWKTPIYRLKKRLMAEMGYTIMEI